MGTRGKNNLEEDGTWIHNLIRQPLISLIHELSFRMDIDFIDKELKDEIRKCMKMQLPVDRTKAQESCKIYFLLFKP